ncbi:MAG: DNA-binding protein [Bacteroidales bacterium]|nr:DNA-binding protein [Bacteroidales bacterium]
MKTFLSILSLIFLLSCTQQKNNQPNTEYSVDINHENPSPECYTVSTDFERIIVVRLKTGTDMLEGLNKAAKEKGIQNGVIINGIGSLTRYRVHVVDNTTFPVDDLFVQADNPVDILGVSGYIIDGRVHCHVTLSDEIKAIGGHLEPGSSVFTFAIITIGELADDTTLKDVDNIKW